MFKPTLILFFVYMYVGSEAPPLKFTNNIDKYSKKQNLLVHYLIF